MLEELESEFDNFDADHSYPTLPFVYKHLFDSHKACKTTLSLAQYQTERLIGLTSILYLSFINYSTVTMVKKSIYDVNTSVQQIRIRSSCYDTTWIMLCGPIFE